VKKLPDSSLAFYISLGPGRTYRDVAAHFNCSKRAVQMRASVEGWTASVAAIEAQARQQLAEEAARTVAEMDQRHLQIAKVLQAKGLEALRTSPIETAGDAMKALDLGIKNERLVRGEPSHLISVEAVTKREIADLLLVEGDPDDDEPHDDEEVEDEEDEDGEEDPAPG
jgi:hypothetical protein